MTTIARTRRAFTLIELIVAVGIILVLLGLVLAVGNVVIGQSEVRQTQNMMEIIESSANEFKLIMGRDATYGEDDEPCNDDEQYDLPQGIKPTPTLQFSLFLISNNELVREMLTKIDPDSLRTVEYEIAGNEFQALDAIDPWGTSLAVIMPGRKYDLDCDPGSYERDEDGTIRTQWEELWACRDARPLFVSAGPDLKFGFGAMDDSSPEYAQDNVFSYEPYTEHSQ